MSFIKETIQRVTAQTPTYFKKIGNMGVGLMASGTAILSPDAISAVIPSVNVHMPAQAVVAASHMLVAGAIMKSVAKLTVTDPDKLG